MEIINFFFYYIFSFTKVKIKKLFFNLFKTNSIPNIPQFSKKDFNYFKILIKNKTNIIEYGMGGSTLFLVNKNKRLISVETDKNFLNIIKKKLLNRDIKKNILFFQNIGETNLWGFPLDNRINKKNVQRWKKYIKSPWKYVTDKNFPDLIIIDGRFRVACAAYALKKLKDKKKGLIFFDDFNSRGYYNEIFKIASLVKKIDRAYIFKPKNVPNNLFENLINKFSKDSR